MRDIDGTVGEFDNSWRNRGEWPLERLDKIRFGGDIAKCICCVRNAEVWIQLTSED